MAVRHSALILSPAVRQQARLLTQRNDPPWPALGRGIERRARNPVVTREGYQLLDVTILVVPELDGMRDLKGRPIAMTQLSRSLRVMLGESRSRLQCASQLQCRSTTCIAGLPTAGAGGVRARARRVAVCAHSNRSDGHAPAGAETAAKLTLQLDHSMGADQGSPGSPQPPGLSLDAYDRRMA